VTCSSLPVLRRLTPNPQHDEHLAQERIGVSVGDEHLSQCLGAED
jgi:hypothetical protein